VGVAPDEGELGAPSPELDRRRPADPAGGAGEDHGRHRRKASLIRPHGPRSPRVSPGEAMRTIRSEQLTDPIAYHAARPVWSGRCGGLRWVDMLAGDVLSLAADGSIARRHVGGVAACVRPRRGGGAVIGIERGFALEEPDGLLTPLGELWSDEGVRMNEGG